TQQNATQHNTTQCSTMERKRLQCCRHTRSHTQNPRPLPHTHTHTLPHTHAAALTLPTPLNHKPWVTRPRPQLPSLKHLTRHTHTHHQCTHTLSHTLSLTHTATQRRRRKEGTYCLCFSSAITQKQG